MKNPRHFFYNYSGVIGKLMSVSLPYILALTISTSGGPDCDQQENVQKEETIVTDGTEKPEVSLKPIYLKKDLLPKMTMTFAMGKNGEVLFASSYGQTKLEISGSSIDNFRELFSDLLGCKRKSCF